MNTTDQPEKIKYKLSKAERDFADLVIENYNIVEAYKFAFKTNAKNSSIESMAFRLLRTPAVKYYVQVKKTIRQQQAMEDAENEMMQTQNQAQNNQTQTDNQTDNQTDSANQNQNQAGEETGNTNTQAQTQNQAAARNAQAGNGSHTAKFNYVNTQVSGGSFTDSDKEKYLQELEKLKRAVTDPMDKAKIIAQITDLKQLKREPVTESKQVKYYLPVPVSGLIRYLDEKMTTDPDFRRQVIKLANSFTEK